MADRDIRAKYIFEDNYEPEYVSGVFGNNLPSGELIMNFYLERLPVPYETIQSLNDKGEIDGSLVITKPNSEGITLRRTIKSGVIMSPSTALSFYQWLKNKLKEMGVDDDEL